MKSVYKIGGMPSLYSPCAAAISEGRSVMPRDADTASTAPAAVLP
jgi:hypothetical protein